MVQAVLDASAVLAVIFHEPGADRVSPILSSCAISAVNVAEVATKLSRLGYDLATIEEIISPLPLTVIALEKPLAMAAGALTARTAIAGLSLGDRVCLVLAQSMGVPALTSDPAWQKVAQDFDIQYIR